MNRKCRRYITVKEIETIVKVIYLTHTHTKTLTHTFTRTR